ncbi:MAG: hypothetical protein ACRC6U_09090 [Fusobacteriaceae bacterium]
MNTEIILGIIKSVPATEIISIATTLATAAGTGIAAGFKYRNRAKKWEKEYWELKKIMDSMEETLEHQVSMIRDLVDKR